MLSIKEYQVNNQGAAATNIDALMLEIVSLPELLEKYAAGWVMVWRILQDIHDAATTDWDFIEEGEETRKILSQALTNIENVKIACDLCHCKITVKSVDRLHAWYAKQLENFPYGKTGEVRTELMRKVGAIQEVLQDELYQRSFYQVAADMEAYYRDKPFDNSVITAFPKSRFDMEEAGKCLALGRSTACMFHLMRIVDSGIKRVAMHFRVMPKNPTWGDIIKALREKRDCETRTGNPDAARSLSHLIETFSSIKGIRDPLDHSDEELPPDSLNFIEEKYTPDEAIRHYANVQAFMVSLVRVIVPVS